MTGFDRPFRSYYLDDMTVVVDDIIICKCNCGVYLFTPGVGYKVQPGKKVYDDNGDLVVPSCRFTYH